MPSSSHEVYDRWFTLGDQADPRRARMHALVERLRRIGDAVVLLDPETSQDAHLALAEEAADQLERQVAVLPHHRNHGTAAGAPVPASMLSERSPISGRMNVAAPPLTLRYRPDVTTASVTYSQLSEGPEGGVHGGVVAASFDELLGVAQMASGAVGYTIELTVRYLRKTPLHVAVTYEAWVAKREGRRIQVDARSTADGVTLCEATGIFLAMQETPVDGTTGTSL